jgi:hypothetical protein
MLDKISPTKYKLTLVYRCPNCSSEYPFDESELKQSNLRWSCGCGNQFLIEKIQDIQLGICYRTDNDPEIINEDVFVSDAVKYVFAMGYDRDLVNRIVNKLDISDCHRKEDVIRKVLAEIDADEQTY